MQSTVNSICSKPATNESQYRQTNISFGSRKIPKYLYHLTTAKNWQGIQESGILNESNDEFIGCGVFMTDLTNLFGKWTAKSLREEGESLIDSLMQFVQKDNSNLVILRIPTSGLKRSNLIIRNQTDTFKTVNNKSFLKWYRNWLDTKEIPNKKFLDLTQGIKAENARKHKHKDPIEYIYREEILLSKVEKIGESKPGTHQSIIDTWKQLLTGTPEEKSIKKLTKK